MNERERITQSSCEFNIWFELGRAISKHPDFAKDPYQAISIITEELGELAQAVNDGDRAQAKVELFHVIATCIRLYHYYISLEDLELNTKEFLNRGKK